MIKQKKKYLIKYLEYAGSYIIVTFRHTPPTLNMYCMARRTGSDVVRTTAVPESYHVHPSLPRLPPLKPSAAHQQRLRKNHSATTATAIPQELTPTPAFPVHQLPVTVDICLLCLLLIWKKHSRHPDTDTNTHPSSRAVTDGMLCFGWIHPNKKNST